MSPNKPKNPNEVLQVSAISPHSEGLYEVGKAILVDSIATGREFCKSMISISAGAIPIYLGILTFILPEDFTLGVTAGITVAAPAIGFLITSILFTFGYLPISGDFSLDIIEEIEQAVAKIIGARKYFIWSGMFMFVASTLAAIYVVIINLGVK